MKGRRFFRPPVFLVIQFCFAAFAPVIFAGQKGLVEEYPLPVPYSYPLDIALDKDDGIWVVLQNANKIVRFDYKTKKFFDVDLPAGSSPTSIASDDKGVVWITLSSKTVNAIGRLSSGAKDIDVYPVPSVEAQPYKIALSSNNIVWFTERNTNRIGRFDGREIKEYKIPSANSQPDGIAVDSKGIVWFSEAVGNNIARLDPQTGNITEFRIPVDYSMPADVMVDKNDKLWFVEMNGNRLVMFDPLSKVFNEAIIPTVNAVPVSLAVGADGIVWFTENRGNKIGSFDPVSAIFKEYAIPTSASLPIGIAIDGSGRVWFTESSRSANKIGVIFP